MKSLPIVSNASPLIALEQIGQLHLLQQLFDTVVVPLAVAREVTPTLIVPDWIEQQPLRQPIGPQIFSASLGAGESEAISLAIDLQARLVILDEGAAPLNHRYGWYLTCC